MRRIRVTGMVREANAIRHALALPMTRDQCDALARRLRTSLQNIDAVLREHNASVGQLPGPSRRAYELLRGVDLGKAQIVDSPLAGDAAGAAAPESITYRGLRAFLDRVLDDMALTLAAGRFKRTATVGVVQRTAGRFDYAMQRDGLRAEHLKPDTRKLVGWFRYFAEPEAFDRYIEAVRRAQAVFGRLPAARTGWQPPLLVHYRPSSHLYRWRVFREGTRIVLGTAMIALDAAALGHVGQQMLGGKRHAAAVTAAMMAEPFQTLAIELEAAAGVVDRTRGLVYDLAEVFDRVNRQHFSGQMPRPSLTWTRTLTGRIFGHYDFVRDRVWISSTLDQAEAPPLVIDHVMHHELLHKKHGFTWQGHRQHTHTRAFRTDEWAFPQYEQAARLLNQLSIA